LRRRSAKKSALGKNPENCSFGVLRPVVVSIASNWRSGKLPAGAGRGVLDSLHGGPPVGRR
jgi:hypothetical protein